MGRGSGGRSSRGGSAEFDSSISFDIYTLRADGSTPTTFDDAIENFAASFSQNVAEEDYIFNFGGDEIRLTVISDASPLDLQAMFIDAGSQIELDGSPILSPGFFGGTPETVVTDADRIEYRLVGDQLPLAGVDELTLFIEDADSDSSNGFQVGGETINVDLATATGGFSESEAIEYIVNEGLLDSADQFRISGEDFNNPAQIVFLERGFDPFFDESAPITPEAVNDSANTQENTAVSIDVLDNDNVGIIESFDANSASGGSITQNGDLLEYTPATDFTGEDTFQYTIDNLGLESTATVTVNVAETETPVVPPEPVTPEPPTETPLLDGDDVISGDNGDNTLNGGEGNNILYGFGGNDALSTGGGNDNLQGDNGDDTLSGGGGNDIITGGAGFDVIDGGDGNDTIDGGGQDDSIFGGSGDDLINGGNGNDTLNGGAGNDVLVGDGGSDVFVVNALGGNDTIRDFNFSQDIIGLSDGITLDQITITQGNGAAIINNEGQAIASISGATPEQLGADKFTVI